MVFIEILVWAALLGIFAAVVLVLDYWGRLLRQQDSYSRDELVDFYRIILRQVEALTGRGDSGLNYLSLAAGVGMAWLLALFGGVLSPDVSLAPDHAEDQIPNYFFQSILFLAILHIVWPSLKDVASDQGGGPDGIASRLLATDAPFFFSFAIALGAINLTEWGVYHQMSFLFSAINAGLCFVYAGYRLHTAGRDTNYEEESGEDREMSARRRPGKEDGDTDSRYEQSDDEPY
jgi:hypothetical protein